jgi:CRP-like cAMP-binding protein
MCIVLDGELQLGDQRALPGQYFGEIGLAAYMPCPGQIIALQPTRILAIKGTNRIASNEHTQLMHARHPLPPLTFAILALPPGPDFARLFEDTGMMEAYVPLAGSIKQ